MRLPTLAARAQTLLALAVLAALAAWAASQAGFGGLTDLARSLIVGHAPVWTHAARVTDGVVAWKDWLPFPAAFPDAGAASAHTIELGLWVALTLAVYGLGRVVGLGAGGALAAAALLAVHPTGAAAWGDVAARGPLLGTLAMVACLALALRPPHPHGARGAAALAAMAALLLVGLGAYPLAVLAPIILVLTSWHRVAAVRRRGGGGAPAVSAAPWQALVVLLAVAAIWMLVRDALVSDQAPSIADHLAVGANGKVGLLAACVLTGRAMKVALLGVPLIGRPWEIDWAHLSWASPLAWLGIALLVGVPIAARQARREVTAFGLWWTWAVLLALSQLAEPLPSAQAPALLVTLLVGPALIFGRLAEGAARLLDGRTAPSSLGVRRTAGLVGVLVGAGALVLAAAATPRAGTWFSSEPKMLAHDLASAPEAIPPRIALARWALAHGDPKRAAELAAAGHAEALAPVRVRAMLALHRWGSARVLLPVAMRAEPNQALVLRCEVAAAALDPGGDRLCMRARAQARPGDLDYIRALVRALDTTHRWDKATDMLVAAVRRRPGELSLCGALVAHLERAGRIDRAVRALDAWYLASGRAPSVRQRLVALLAAQGRRDLIANQPRSAVRALGRALDLDPSRDRLRYVYADSLEAVGRANAAKAQRKLARAHGALPPGPPNRGGR